MEEKVQEGSYHRYDHKMLHRAQSQALFRVHSDKTRGSEHKLKHRRFTVNVKKNFFTVRMTEPQDSLPQERVQSTLLKILKSI